MREISKEKIMEFNISQLKWTREPQSYDIKEDKIEMITKPYTDLWQRTYYHFRNDNAPVLQMKTKEKYFSFVVKTEFESHQRFDQCGYWDYDAPNIPNEPRDASAAACTASALYELDGYLPGNHYKETADKIMESLGSPAYRAEVGTNGNFILMHSVGSIPHGQEIDVPLNYADYYFLEGLMRKRDLEKK